MFRCAVMCEWDPWMMPPSNLPPLTGYVNDLFRFDLSGLYWSKLDDQTHGSPPSPRCSLGMTSDASSFFVFGGWNHANHTIPGASPISHPACIGMSALWNPFITMDNRGLIWAYAFLSRCQVWEETLMISINSTRRLYRGQQWWHTTTAAPLASPHPSGTRMASRRPEAGSTFLVVSTRKSVSPIITS